jgi:hypothetical protein
LYNMAIKKQVLHKQGQDIARNIGRCVLSDRHSLWLCLFHLKLTTSSALHEFMKT